MPSGIAGCRVSRRYHAQYRNGTCACRCPGAQQPRRYPRHLERFSRRFSAHVVQARKVLGEERLPVIRLHDLRHTPLASPVRSTGCEGPGSRGPASRPRRRDPRRSPLGTRWGRRRLPAGGGRDHREPVTSPGAYLRERSGWRWSGRPDLTRGPREKHGRSRPMSGAVARPPEVNDAAPLWSPAGPGSRGRACAGCARCGSAQCGVRRRAGRRSAGWSAPARRARRPAVPWA